MQLPDFVRRIIEEQAEAVGFAALKRAATTMSEGYRSGSAARIPDAERAAAYLATRMPATYAAAYSVLGEVRARLGERSIATILDIGSGTGAASLAARAWFPDAVITLVEHDSAFARIARLLIPDAKVQSLNFPLPKYDLVIASYSLGEIREPIVLRLWESAAVALVVIEPGTPQGFTFIRGIRTDLLNTGGRMVAPCPAESPCPMAGNDWCHFAARVERSSIHRRLKEGTLGHEDEKYSYVAVARDAVQLPTGRVIRHPQHRPGLVILETCTAAGLTPERFTKRDRDAFRVARKRNWGDPLDR